jgi:hypothetical protein
MDCDFQLSTLVDRLGELKHSSVLIQSHQSREILSWNSARVRGCNHGISVGRIPDNHHLASLLGNFAENMTFMLEKLS